MALTARQPKQYHVFLASPGDVNAERQHMRKFFERYNNSTAQLWNAEFKVIDWENFATIGVGRPQELITRQTEAASIGDRRWQGRLRCGSAALGSIAARISGPTLGDPGNVRRFFSRNRYDPADPKHR